MTLVEALFLPVCITYVCLGAWAGGPAPHRFCSEVLCEVPPKFTGPQFLYQLNLDISLSDPASTFPALAFSHMDQETSAVNGHRKVRIVDR